MVTNIRKVPYHGEAPLHRTPSTILQSKGQSSYKTFQSSRERERVHTQMQWENLLVFPSSTARKVAKIGAKRPYATPVRTLQAIPSSGHETRRKARHMQIKSFRTGPNCFVLHRIPIHMSSIRLHECEKWVKN